MTLRVATLVGLSLAALACNSVTPVKEPELVDEVLKALCATQVRCGIESSQAGCVAVFKASQFTWPYDRDAAAAAAGRKRYDGASARRCVEAYASASCARNLLNSYAPPDCFRIYVGRAMVGEPCNPGECVFDAFCSSELDSKCPAICRPRVGAGGAATSPLQCAQGLVLVKGLCGNPGQPDGPCNESTFPSTCADDLVCDSLKCKPFKAEGEACSSTAPCGNFRPCLGGACRPLGDVGASCAVQSSLGGRVCKWDLRCADTDGGWVCADYVVEGGACALIDGECRPDLACFGAPDAGISTCQQHGSLGDPCTNYSCANGLLCDPATSTCQGGLPFGRPCSDDTVCGGGFCIRGTCQPAPGSTCP